MKSHPKKNCSSPSPSTKKLFKWNAAVKNFKHCIKWCDKDRASLGVVLVTQTARFEGNGGWLLKSKRRAAPGLLNGSGPVHTSFQALPRLAAQICASIFASIIPLCSAADTDANAVRFAIRSYVVDGSLQLPIERVQAAVQPFIGQSETFEDIQRAVAAVQELYVASGFVAVQVIVPQQDISAGIVRLRVIEPRVGKVDVIGNQYFDLANIRNSMPALREGQTPNLRAIGASIRLANESYAKQTQITFKQTDAPESATQASDLIDATVRVADVNPIRNIVTLDNTGTAQTGQYRIGYAFQHANLFNLDHVLTAQYITSPDHVKDVSILSANYRIPFYSVSGLLDLSASYSNVNSGNIATPAGNYAISGSGNVLGVKYTYLLPRFGEWDHRVSAGLDYRYIKNNVSFAGANTSLIPDLVARPVTLSYAGFSREGTREWRANVSFSKNIAGGEKNSTAAYQAPGGRAGATADFSVWRYNVFLRQMLPADWQAQWQLNGQYTSNALISGEQFGIGGVDSVRGFNEREVLNDRGYRTSLELQGPNLGKAFESDQLQLRPAVFYDAGWVQRNRPLPGEQTHTAISSAGVGLRANFGSNLQARVDYAAVLEGGGVRKSGDRKLHASVLLTF